MSSARCRCVSASNSGTPSTTRYNRSISTPVNACVLSVVGQYTSTFSTAPARPRPIVWRSGLPPKLPPPLTRR